jgi:hypothetical protein
MLVCGCCGALDCPMLLVSEEASSSAVGCRSSLLICASGDTVGASLSTGDDCRVEFSAVVSILSGCAPLMGSVGQSW